MSFTYFIPTKTLFGAGQLNHLHEHINTPQGCIKAKKALLVISNGTSAKKNGYLNRVEMKLKQAGVETILFDKIQPNPIKSTVEEGGKLAEMTNCDLIVALGGGSVMDAAKAIAMSARNFGNLWHYVQSGTGGKKFPEYGALPIIAITTTAGTGSETDCGAVITNPETHEKTGIIYDCLFPTLAIVDPELMKTVPAHLKAYQGFDALFHSTEGYISAVRNEMSKTVATKAIKSVSRNLAQSIKDPEDMKALTQVAFGNYLSGIQMCVGSCTSEHSLEHAMSAYHPELPHGAGLIMLSKAYYQFFIDKHVCDQSFIEMAKLFGMKNATQPEDFITALSDLQKACGVDDLKMSSYGIVPSEFEKLAKNAMDSMGFLFDCDPYKLTLEDCISIYQSSYK